MKTQDLLRYRKDPRVVVSASLVILVATTLVYYLVQRARELSPDALSSRVVLFVLWNINLILILGILFVLLRGLIKLVVERHRGMVGSRFRTKLVATYALISLIPIALLFVIATDLLRVSVDRWFNMPVRRLVQNSEQIAQVSQDRAIRQAEYAARDAAVSMAVRARPVDQALDHVRQFHDVDLVGIYQNGGLIQLLANPRSPVHTIREPSPKFFEEVRRKGSARKIDVMPEGKWIRFGVPVTNQPGMAAITGIFVPSSASVLIDENLIAYQNFLQLDSQRPALKAAQTSLLLSVTLFLLFGSLWTAIVVSRRITVPIQALAEGTRTLAQGNYGHRVEVRAEDEIGVLVDSFNQMSGQLQSQREALTDTNIRLDEERAFLLTVMDSVATGIIAVDESLSLLSINPAAKRILQLEELPRGAALDQALRQELPELAEYLRELRERETASREITVVRGGELRYLEVSAARLNGASGGGWVVAFEDLTRLVQAQKLAAWNEAARRIAHEIKNPLTPIQLSAERIARKFRAGDGDVDGAIEEGTRTIVDEVGQLKRMVDEFSRFARMPAVNLRQTDLNQILREVARLYSEIKPGVSVTVKADPSLQAVVDPEQIRRALINLLDNAVEATDQGEITLQGTMRDRTVLIQVSDPGRGVSDADKEKLFLPHFSTKGRDTGLGLAIVHRIVHDHDGRISVHDNQPHGTRFEIEIPA